MQTYVKKHCVLAIAAASTWGNLTAAADSVMLEEVIVTAQKRAENLQDVPISVSALSGDKINEAGLQRFDQLSAYIPNFTVSQYEIGDVINIRGLASGIQAGFEQSVGTFVDGVYRGRSVQSRFAFLDVGTIEVLRGPQGTLFGKNTIAGAVNITSAKPTSELEGEIRSTYNLDFEELELSGYISGSLSDSLRVRTAFISREMEEGWTQNQAYNSNDPNTDELAGRISFEWDASDDTLISFKYEKGDWDNNGQPMELVNAGPLALIGVEDNVDYRSNIGAVGDNVLDIGSVQTFEGDIEEFAVTLVHNLDNGSEITAIAAQSQYNYQRAIDADLSPLPLIRFDDNEELQQTSFELRIASDTGGAFEYIGGAYYHQADLTAEGITYASINSVNALSTAGCAAAGGVQTLAATGTNANAATAYNCELALVTSTLPLDGVGRYAKLEQETETWAVFAQSTWNMTDTLRSTLGIRYTEEVKEGNQGVYAVDYQPGNTAASANLVSIASAEQLLEFTTHNFNDLKRDEESFTWSANIQWDVNDNTMAYATASTGFKAGGFNSFFMGDSAGSGASSSDVDFDEEDVLAFEIGSKMSLLDGAAELNIALFRTQFDNLQVSVFSGNTTFKVQNAAEATTQGIEIDGRWQATEALLLSGSFGWTDFEFDQFSNQACTADQYGNYLEQAYSSGNFAAAGIGVVPGFYTAADCATDGVNDLKGRTSANSPEFSATLSSRYHQPVGNYEFTYVLDLIYTDSSYLQGDLDPVLQSDEHVMVNAVVHFSPQSSDWEISLIGKNLTDENEMVSGNDNALVTGASFASIMPPRSVSIAGTYRF